jgi:endothelin-converting enzyme/putative endopeptidase
MALQALLTDTPPATLKQYLAWRVFEAQAHAAGRTLIDEEFRFHGAFLLGRTQLPPDWWVCLGATRSVFGFALAKEFVARFVPTDPRPAVVDLFDRVRRAMRDALTAAGWLDEPTRSRALEKLDRLTATVGYPDEWPTTTGLAIGPGTSYLEGWRAVSRWWAARAADRLGAPVIPGQFRTSPDVTNAFYSWSFNDVQLPLGIILDPFFWPERPAALNYGALGSIVAHEITHAFDESGRRFDGAGKLVDWWTDSVEGEFGARAQCLVDQYAAYEPVPGTRIDGRLTLGENLADLGGATLAHAAYRSAPANGTLVSRFSADQHFFLSLAQRSCAVESPPYLQVLLRTDPHAPRRFRVNGTLRNVPAFGAAFQCPEGATLNPTVRCALW